MDYFPKFNVTRFEQLKAGDLFIVELSDVRLVALKAIDTQSDGDKLMVLLGPNFPSYAAPGLLAPWQAATVVSIGSGYIVHLPTEPENWATTSPPPEVVPLVLQDQELYVRGSYGQSPREFNPCLVRLSDGKVSYGQNHDIRAYATGWKILTADGDQKARRIM